ncbi:MAG: hypothetical protein HZA89_07860 [Verrucomicrobia bacterium]|nr:hypothetical protein [Verrucomicrobiota bacterium]
MKLFRLIAPRWLLVLLFASVAIFLTGCATTEAGNDSARPWNQPKGWENGLPGGMFDRERR